jgi:hypothetical protein
MDPQQGFTLWNGRSMENFQEVNCILNFITAEE